MQHTIPDGDVAAIFERALTPLLADLRRTKHALVSRPRVTWPHGGSGGRHIPAWVISRSCGCGSSRTKGDRGGALRESP